MYPHHHQHYRPLPPFSFWTRALWGNGLRLELMSSLNATVTIHHQRNKTISSIEAVEGARGDGRDRAEVYKMTWPPGTPETESELAQKSQFGFCDPFYLSEGGLEQHHHRHH